MPDFGILQSPNFGAAALGAFQAGQAMGRQKQVESALQGVDLKRPETITSLLKVDPEHGIALLGASNALLKNERDIAARQATTDYLTARFKPAANGVTTGGVPNGVPAAPQEDDAWAALVKADPDGALQLRQQLDQMDEKQRGRLVESQTALHDMAVATAGLPYDQRKAFIQAHANELSAHYVTPEQIAGFDPTDQNLEVVRQQALGVKGAAELADKAAARAETARHNRASEGNEASRLVLAQKREARITKWGPQPIIVGGSVPTNTDDLDY